ncbi:MAG: ComEC/Rec2-related protein [Pedosphaera sp.]|nr:ComEC/Rec2-related protein [Pedosphaera sp.]
MKRPLIAVALLYVGGILLAGLPMPLVPLFVSAFVLAFLFFVWTAARRILLCALIVLTGWINLAQRTTVLSPNDLRTILPHPEEILTIRGKLSETPYHRVHEAKDKEVWSSMVRIETTAIRLGEGEWQPADGKIIASTKEFLPETFFAGQIVEVNGVLHQVRRPVTEGLFDYRAFLAHQGIYHQLDVKWVADWRIVSTPSQPPLSDQFCNWARKTIALGLPVEDESLRLEWALTLGWKAALTEEVSEPFIKAATYHIFAVDGLRIAIVSGILVALFRVLGIPRAWCGLLAVPFIGFYAAMTGWPASAIRAIVMITVVFGGWALKRPSDFLNSLFMAALIILVWEPRQLFQAGFQLSFFVVLCIILILPAFKRLENFLLQTDPLIPEILLTGWQKTWREAARWLIGLFFTSVAAWLGSIPLVVWYFHLVTPVSGPANVLAVPLCALVLICNLSAMLFAWVPFITVLFNHAGWFLMECIRATSHWSANWPGAYFYAPMPGFFTIALYYLILLTALTGWLFKGKSRHWKIGSVVCLTVLWCGLWLRERPSASFTILPLNGGHAIYFQSPNGGSDWLIDCGSESAVAGVMKPFLQAQGVNRLDNLLLTHGEINYSGGAPLITQLFRPRNLYTSAIHFRSPGYREFAADAKDQPAWRAPLQAGDHLGPWTILYPPSNTKFAKANDNPLALLGEIHGIRILLLSDLSHLGQNALLNATAASNNTNNLHADIVIAGPPGDSEPLNEALLDAIQPRVIIIADSQQPANKRASAKLKDRLALRNLQVCYTSASDAVTFTIRTDHWELRSMDGMRISNTP